MRRPPAVSLALFAFVLLAPHAGRAAAAAPAMAPPSDAELTRFVALENDIAADAGRAAQFCTLQAQAEHEADSQKTPAEIGRRLDANPLFGPLLRRHGLSGQRYTEVTLQAFGGALGLGMADDLDSTARAKGLKADNREQLLARSAEARAVAPRLAELTAALDKVGKLCAGDEEDEDAGAEEPESEEKR